jgi:dolichol-phosphate mannosyltransferase
LSGSGNIVAFDRYAARSEGGRLVQAAGRPGTELAPPRVTIVLPARNEGERITAVLDRLFAAVRLSCEVLVVVDSAADPTVTSVNRYRAGQPRLRCRVHPYGGGPAGAIRFGLEQAAAPVVVVTMADGSDDPAQIDELALLVERGAVVAAASRYAAGGAQLGAPWLKSSLSRLAGRSLQLLARPGTCDATNSFKAYSADFASLAGVQSRRGFAVGIELTAKARRLRLPVAEIPTTWRERTAGRSGFRLARWLPAYLRWYLFCFGRPLTPGQLGAGRPLRSGGAAGD